MKAFKLILGFIVIIVSVILFNNLASVAGVILGSVIFTAPGGVATPFTFNMTYLPQFLTWNDVVPLTSLRVETQEDGVLHDWVTLSLTAMNGYMIQGAQAANIKLMRIANGKIPGRNVTISGVTSAAGAIAFSECSDCIGNFAFKSNNAQILANNPTRFENFTCVWVPAMAAGDLCEVDYKSGHRQTYTIADLAAVSSLYQEVPNIMVNNINAYVKSATFTCAAAHPAYLLSVKL